MTILELSSGCPFYLLCFLDSSWLGLTESRSVPTRIAITCDGSSRTRNGQTYFPFHPLLGEPVTWGAVRLPSVDSFSNFEGRDRFRSHVLQFWMATSWPTTVKNTFFSTSDIDVEEARSLFDNTDWRSFCSVTFDNQKALTSSVLPSSCNAASRSMYGALGVSIRVQNDRGRWLFF